MKNNQISLIYKHFFFIIFVFFVFLLQFSLYGCIFKKSQSNYHYISEQQQRVLELCSLVYTDPYYQYISPSRKIRLKKIRTTSWGFWANFADGRSYRVPIQSGLNLGKDYYCSFQRNTKYCLSLDDLDFECEWK